MSKGRRQELRVRPRSDPPDERRVVRVRRDDTTERPDGRRVRSAVIANQSSGLNLTGQMLPRPLHALGEPGRGRRRLEDVDHHRRHVRVHLELWTAEALSTGVRGEPVTRNLLFADDHGGSSPGKLREMVARRASGAHAWCVARTALSRAVGRHRRPLRSNRAEQDQ